jgi:hypothetical protein
VADILGENLQLTLVEPQAGLSIRKLADAVGSAWNFEARALDDTCKPFVINGHGQSSWVQGPRAMLHAKFSQKQVISGKKVEHGSAKRGHGRANISTAATKLRHGSAKLGHGEAKIRNIPSKLRNFPGKFSNIPGKFGKIPAKLRKIPAKVRHGGAKVGDIAVNVGKSRAKVPRGPIVKRSVGHEVFTLESNAGHGPICTAAAPSTMPAAHVVRAVPMTVVL